MALSPEYKKLIWKCRRGSKELDLVLCYYLENNYTQSSPEQKQAFHQLLDYSDPDIQDLINGIAVSDNKALNHLVHQMCGHERSAYK